MEAVRAGDTSPEAVRKQGRAGMRKGSRLWQPESSLMGRRPESCSCGNDRQAQRLSERPQKMTAAPGATETAVTEVTEIAAWQAEGMQW